MFVLRKIVKRMSSSNDNKRINVEEDRLSSLLDGLIHRILSSISIKQVVEMSVLSSRWRFIWISMPYFNLSRDDFSKLPYVWKFIKHIFLLRSYQAELSSVNLSFYGESSDFYIKQIAKFAFSHNIQQLNIACLLNNNNNDVEFSDFLISSPSLKHLSVTQENFPKYLPRTSRAFILKAPSTLEFPALTTLYLHHVHLCCDENTNKCVDFFSKFTNLKNLTLKGCTLMEGFKGLSIHLPLLTNLTLESIYVSESFYVNGKVMNIVAPQLKNLTIRSGYIQKHQYVISAPDLIYFHYKGEGVLQLFTDGFLSLHTADICVSFTRDAHQFVRLLQHLRYVKHLTLNLEILEHLSSSVEVISNQPSPFSNLKSLKIHPDSEFLEMREYENYIITKDILKISAEVKKYLLDSSPGATFRMVTLEDIRDMRNTKNAQDLITELRELLERPKPQFYKQHDRDIHYNINRCSKFVSLQIERGKQKASNIIPKLKEMKDLLGKVPASNTANILMNEIADFVKMNYDESKKHLMMS